MINYTAGLIVAVLLIVEVIFVAVPAFRRLVRNIRLTRKGKTATGRYLISTKVVFFLEEKKRIEFVTWRNSSAKRKALEILYDPEHPEQAEVRNSKMLWLKPVDTLALTIGLVAMACALVLGVSYVLAVCLFLACVVLLWLLIRILLLALVILSVKFKPFRRLGTHLLAGFQITKKQSSSS